jgi:hypothetical protein
VRFTENGQDLQVGNGLWLTAGPLSSYRAYVADADSAAVAVQTALRDGEDLVQLLLRLKLRDGLIAEIETLIAREGDTCCWDPERLETLSEVYTQEVPLNQRGTREQLIAAADAYFTALHTASTSQYRSPPVADDMNRYENGRQTTNVVNGNQIIRWDAKTQLDRGMFGAISVVNRRYSAVDIERGTLLGTVVFTYPNSDRPAEIISEFFKIQAGTIREIRAVMVKRPSTGWP